jgi:hypothetical protein
MRLLPFDYAIRNLARSPKRLALMVGGSMLASLLVLGAVGFGRRSGELIMGAARAARGARRHEARAGRPAGRGPRDRRAQGRVRRHQRSCAHA